MDKKSEPLVEIIRVVVKGISRLAVSITGNVTLNTEKSFEYPEISTPFEVTTSEPIFAYSIVFTLEPAEGMVPELSNLFLKLCFKNPYHTQLPTATSTTSTTATTATTTATTTARPTTTGPPVCEGDKVYKTCTCTLTCDDVRAGKTCSDVTISQGIVLLLICQSTFQLLSVGLINSSNFL